MLSPVATSSRLMFHRLKNRYLYLFASLCNIAFGDVSLANLWLVSQVFKVTFFLLYNNFYLRSKIRHMLLAQKPSEESSAGPSEANSLSIFTQNVQGRFELQPGIKFHMFVSQPPCGDACICDPSTAAPEVAAHPSTQSFAQGVVPTGCGISPQKAQQALSEQRSYGTSPHQAQKAPSEQPSHDTSPQQAQEAPSKQRYTGIEALGADQLQWASRSTDVQHYSLSAHSTPAAADSNGGDPQTSDLTRPELDNVNDNADVPCQDSGTPQPSVPCQGSGTPQLNVPCQDSGLPQPKVPCPDSGTPQPNVPCQDSGTPQPNVPCQDSGTPQPNVPCQDSGALQPNVPCQDSGVPQPTARAARPGTKRSSCLHTSRASGRTGAKRIALAALSPSSNSLTGSVVPKELQSAPQGLQAASQGLQSASQGSQLAPQGVQSASRELQSALQGLQSASQGSRLSPQGPQATSQESQAVSQGSQSSQGLQSALLQSTAPSAYIPSLGSDNTAQGMQQAGLQPSTEAFEQGPRATGAFEQGPQATGAFAQGPQATGAFEQGPQATGVLRRKPGRGDATLSMSCSDKLAKWCCLGIQVSSLSVFVARGQQHQNTTA